MSHIRRGLVIIHSSNTSIPIEDISRLSFDELAQLSFYIEDPVLLTLFPLGTLLSGTSSHNPANISPAASLLIASAHTGQCSDRRASCKKTGFSIPSTCTIVRALIPIATHAGSCDSPDDALSDGRLDVETHVLTRSNSSESNFPVP